MVGMKRRVVRWSIIVCMVTAIIISAGIVLRHWVNSSSTGSVRMGTPSTVAQTDTAMPTDPINVTSPYFATTLPSGFSIKRHQQVTTDGPILFQLAANTNSTTDQQFAATIGTTPSDGLAGIASYHLRTTDTATYGSYTASDLPSGAVAFRTRSGPAAITIFWPQSNRYAELTFSSDGGASIEPLESLYTHVLGNWTWK